ncbi:DNA-binding protein [Mycobacterium sp. TY814]|uniref:DNA-binding protein n=1 Tax=Mycobacterium sp. TY814 TaxID=3050580 RepID=UPI002741FBA0|nr:DNA-binding protein [Mycobacterium sp. TY814]MDP7720754.1 DNA-binding protein [Mycobacterium sp. TY814]
MPTTTVSPAIPFDEPEALVPPRNVARHFHTTEAVLAQERYRGVGIPYVRHGRRIFYRVKDIRAYIDANTETPRA